MIVAAVILFLATLAVDLVTDYRLYVERKVVHHIRGAWLRCAGLGPTGLCLLWAGRHHHVILLILCIAAMLFFTYWWLFDGLYNLLIGQRWSFVGTTAWLDKQKRKYPFLIPARYIGSALFILIYVIIRL